MFQKKYLKYLISIIALLIISIGYFVPDINSKQINENYFIIESNFNNIKNMPGAELLNADNLDIMKKSNLVFIGGHFKLDASYEEIKGYYMTELQNEGWNFVNEDSPKEMGIDKGYKTLDFQKDEMELELFYIPPDLQKDGCSFDISISWDFG